jgi:hypothetical protein
MLKGLTKGRRDTERGRERMEEGRGSRCRMMKGVAGWVAYVTVCFFV